MINQSSDTFHMKCVPGFDGGMNQTFHILVRDRASNTIKYDNASLARPELIIGKSRYPPSLHTLLLIYDLLMLISTRASNEGSRKSLLATLALSHLRHY